MAVAVAPAGASDGGNTPLDPAIAGIIAKPQYAHASWGLLDVPVPGSATTWWRADEMFVPGSTTKLFSVSAVWKLLGPDHRFRTPIFALGRRTRGTLRGDLVLQGVGDLSLGGRTTREGGIAYTNIDHIDANGVPGASLTPQNPLAGIDSLARQVRRAGIRRVAGDVVVDDRLFQSTFDTQPTPVMINDDLIDLIVTPTRAGQPARVSYRPHAATVSVEANVRTVARGGTTDIEPTGQAPGRIAVTGTVAAGQEPVIRVAPIADPAAFARTVLIEALRRAGVRVDAGAGGPNPTQLLPATRSYAGRRPVALLVSPPYRDFAKLILKVSHNLGADTGVCLLAVRAGSRDCDAGLALIAQFLRRRGVDLRQVILADGAGGDSADRITPTAVIQLLRYWLTQPDFAAFRACLPILGVDGSLASNAVNTPARGKVFAKTGTAATADLLGNQLALQAKALAGFFRGADGRWHVFDVVVNNAGTGPGFQPALDAGEDIAQIAARLWQVANP